MSAALAKKASLEKKCSLEPHSPTTERLGDDLFVPIYPVFLHGIYTRHIFKVKFCLCIVYDCFLFQNSQSSSLPAMLTRGDNIIFLQSSIQNTVSPNGSE